MISSVTTVTSTLASPSEKEEFVILLLSGKRLAKVFFNYGLYTGRRVIYVVKFVSFSRAAKYYFRVLYIVIFHQKITKLVCYMCIFNAI